jgi:hypothetical protein
MVSTAVLLLLLALLLQIFGNTSRVLGKVNKDLDLGSASRMSLDKIAGDFSSMLSSGGLGPVILKQPDGNDALAFLGQVRSPSRADVDPSAIRMAAVVFSVRSATDRVLSRNNQPALVRGIAPVVDSAIPPANAANNPVAALRAAAADLSSPTQLDFPQLDFQTLTADVFRMEISFLLDDGTITQIPPGSRAMSELTGFTSGNLQTPAIRADDSLDPGGRFVTALIIDLGLLGPNVRQLLPEGEVAALAAKLPDGVEGTASLPSWNSISFDSQPVKEGIRFCQRYVFIN